MMVYNLTLGLYRVHCYILEEEGQVVLIDPGARVDLIEERLRALGSPQVLAIILTHGHVDHTSAASDLADTYGCPVYAHPLEEAVIRLKRLVPRAYVKAFDVRTRDLEEGPLRVGPFDLTIYHMPGHSPGHLVIACQNHLFTGDLLFRGTVGTTDIFGGSQADLHRSLNSLLAWPDETLVHPGHGLETSIGAEREKLLKRLGL